MDIRVYGYWKRDWPVIRNQTDAVMSRDPLSVGIARGELAMGLCGLLSTVSTMALFLWITYKLWRRGPQKRPQQPPEAAENIWGVTPSPHLPVRPTMRPAVVRSRDSGLASTGTQTTQRTSRANEKDPGPNSFLILIYNLLLGDINQSMAFCFSLVWFKEGDVKEGAACWAQGWFINSGRLSTAVFFTLISLYTFLALILGRPPGKIPLYITITCSWAFTYFMMVLGIILTRNGKDSGGWYIPLSIWVRLSSAFKPYMGLTWRLDRTNTRSQCWVNDEYGRLRFWLEYFWIFLSVCLTTFLYTLIFAAIYFRRQLPDAVCDRLGRRYSCRGVRHQGGNRGAAPRPTAHHPAFLLYPFIYLACTVPIGAVRLLTDSGYEVGYLPRVVAGALVALHGGLNVLLWTLTLIYLPTDQLDETGLSQFMRTPANRQYGNLVWIQGASSRPNLEDGLDPEQHPPRVNWFGRLDQAKSFCFLSRAMSTTSHGSNRASSQISLRRPSRMSDVQPFLGPSNCIHMDTVTTVVEEPRQEDLCS